jgi:GNAT superfamily N-acetyltransferase
VIRGSATERRMTSDRAIPTDPSMLPEAFGLFRDAYLRAAHANPYVPPLTADHEARLRGRVQRALDHGGMAVLRAGRLLGFMVASDPFPYRGLVAALVPEHAHAAAPADAATVYPLLYGAVAERLVGAGVHLHLIGHFAADPAATASLVDLGFGAVVAERLRGVDHLPPGDVEPDRPAGGRHGARIDRIDPAQPWDAFAPMAAEHADFYRHGPIFVVKDASLEAARSDLEEHRQAGDQLFVGREDGRTLAYLVVGRCPGITEGRLLGGTSTAQVRSAYAVPDVRGQGFGTALLGRAIAWAAEAGFERLFVEHETANPLGGPFWRRHFAPFVTFSMRYVDRSL